MHLDSQFENRSSTKRLHWLGRQLKLVNISASSVNRYPTPMNETFSKQTKYLLTWDHTAVSPTPKPLQYPPENAKRLNLQTQIEDLSCKRRNVRSFLSPSFSRSLRLTSKRKLHNIESKQQKHGSQIAKFFMTGKCSASTLRQLNTVQLTGDISWVWCSPALLERKMYLCVTVRCTPSYRRIALTVPWDSSRLLPDGRMGVSHRDAPHRVFVHQSFTGTHIPQKQKLKRKRKKKGREKSFFPASAAIYYCYCMKDS